MHASRLPTPSPSPSSRHLPMSTAGRAPARLARLVGAGLALALLASCSDGGGNNDDVDAGALDALDAGASDAAADAAEQDVGAPTTLKWGEYSAPVLADLTAVAAVPGEPGAYVLVGEENTVLRFDGATFVADAPAGLGQADLRGVWVTPAGRTIVAGDGSALAVADEDGWTVAGEVPPTPAVRFRAVAGNADDLAWAVGEAAAAWRFDGTVWAPEEVSVTGVTDATTFVDVAVGADDTVWLLGREAGADAGVLVRGGPGAWQSWPLDGAPRALAIGDGEAGAPVAVVVGGTLEAWGTVFDGTDFKSLGSSELQWQQAFGTVAYRDGRFIAGAKGQLRALEAGAWSIVDVKSPVGTRDPIGPIGDDFVGIAIAGPEELLAITPFAAYRYGQQP